MAKKVLVTVAVIAVCVVLYYWYTNRVADNRLDSGNVYSGDSSTDLDGRSQVKPTPSRSDAPGTVNTAPVAPGSVSNQPPASAKSTIAGGQAQTMKFDAPVTANAVPVSDSESPNSPNGMRYGGGGARYQWYRQGNLTWRVDSTSGATCVAFATMEEWRKAIVSQHGCGNA